MPCMKRVYKKTNRRRYNGQQPGTKSTSRPADKPLVNRGFCSSVGLHGMFVLPKSRSQGLSLIRRGVRGSVLSWANRSVGVPFCPALPSPPLRRARSPAQTRPWYVLVLGPANSENFFVGIALLSVACSGSPQRQHRPIGQQAGTTSDRGPADKPLVLRSLCSPIGLNGISFVRALWRTGPSASHPHHPLCAAPPKPARRMSGFWAPQVYVGFRLFVLPKRGSIFFV